MKHVWIGKVLFATVCALLFLLSAVQAEDISSDKAENIIAALPEVKAWGSFIEKQSEGKAHGAFMSSEKPETVEGHKGRFWSVSFYESNKSDMHRWETFLVSLDGRTLLVEQMEDDPMPLSAWRVKQKPMDRIKAGQ
jgi:hypothetical protein